MNYKYLELAVIWGGLFLFLGIASFMAYEVSREFNDSIFSLCFSFIVIFGFLCVFYYIYQGLIYNLCSSKLRGFKEIYKAYTKKTDTEENKIDDTCCKPQSLDEQIKLFAKSNLKNEQESIEQLYKAILKYAIKEMSSQMDEENLNKLCKNIKLYFSEEYPNIEPISTFGRLRPIDIKHFGWNIGTRIKERSGTSKATFIKKMFPTELKESEVSTIERTLRERGTCVIPIIELDDDSFGIQM